MNYSDLVCELRDSNFPFPGGSKMKAFWRSDLADVLTRFWKNTNYAEAAGLCPCTQGLSGSALGLCNLSIRKEKQWTNLAATQMRLCRFLFSKNGASICKKQCLSVEQTVHNWNQREPKISEGEMQNDRCLKRLEVLLVLASCVIYPIYCVEFFMPTAGILYFLLLCWSVF